MGDKAISSFDAAFLAARQAHLVNKLAYTELALNRVGMPTKYREYKEEVLIPQITAALMRIKQGTYGICRDCDEEIERERLIRHPQVCRCVGCQRKYENTPPHRRPTTTTTSKR